MQSIPPLYVPGLTFLAYVRRRGNQLAIVHVEREEGTGKVQQRILFTIYSKAEAHEILGPTTHRKMSHARRSDRRSVSTHYASTPIMILG